MKNAEWVCCFCHEEIQVTYTDPCFLNLTTNRDRDEVQEFACHTDCLNRLLHPDFALVAQT